MTPKELQAEAQAIRALLGPKGDVTVGVETSGQPLQGGMWPNGITARGYFRVAADTWPELFAAMRAEWETRRQVYHAEAIERMALAIIAITSRTGSCSEAALRVDFASQEVEMLGALAVEKANAMAANGPFSIERSANSNSEAAA